MSLSMITLPTNKSVSVVDDDTRTIRQSEMGLVLPVTVLDADGSAYDLTGKTIIFSEYKDGGQSVIDDGKTDGGGIIQIVDATAGKFNYTLQEQVYAASGTCWFEIKTGDTVIDTTKNFYIKVDADSHGGIINSSYIATVKSLEDHLKGCIVTAEDTLNAQLKQMQSDTDSTKQDTLNKLKQAQDNIQQTLTNVTDEYNSYAQKYAQLVENLEQQQKTIEADAHSSLTQIQQLADSQLANLKQANDAQIADTIKDVIAKRDAQLKQASDDFSNKLSSLQSDYDTWKSTTLQDFNTQISNLKSELDSDNTQAQELKQTLTDTQTQVSHLLDKFSDVDFSQFVKTSDFETFKANVYDKATVDDMVAKAGKVKTVEGNGPDGNGNVPLPGWHKVAMDFDTNGIATLQEKSARGFYPVDQVAIQNLMEKLPQKYALKSSDDSKIPIVQGSATDDLYTFRNVTQIRVYDTIGNNVKNVPYQNNYFFVLVNMSRNWGSLTYFGQNCDVYFNSCNGDNWAGWQKLVTQYNLDSKVNISDPLSRGTIDQGTNWQQIFGNNALDTSKGHLTVFKNSSNDYRPYIFGYSASGVAFGAGDTKGVLSVRWDQPGFMVAGGNGNGPKWAREVAWKDDITNLTNQLNTLQQKMASITPAVTLTQAQYNALSDTQKNSDTVYIING